MKALIIHASQLQTAKCIRFSGNYLRPRLPVEGTSQHFYGIVKSIKRLEPKEEGLPWYEVNTYQHRLVLFDNDHVELVPSYTKLM